MKTHHIASTCSVAAAILLSACGGGGSDWQAPEVALCRSALVRIGGVSPASVDGPLVSSSLYHKPYGVLLDFSNGENMDSPRYVTYGSCQISEATILRVMLPGGSVFQGP